MVHTIMSKPIFLILCLGVALVLIAGGIIFATKREASRLFMGGDAGQDSLLPQVREEGGVVSLATQTPTGAATTSGEEVDSGEPMSPFEEVKEEAGTQESVPPTESQPTFDIREPSEPAPKPKTKSTTHMVSIGASNFVPQLLTTYVGDKVCWVNNDSQLHWPASDPHPTHTGLSDFDPLADLLPGETFCYTFREPGAASYHDHTQAVINDVATITGGVRVLPRE